MQEHASKNWYIQIELLWILLCAHTKLMYTSVLCTEVVSNYESLIRLFVEFTYWTHTNVTLMSLLTHPL